jgi:hypothetical protein
VYQDFCCLLQHIWDHLDLSSIITVTHTIIIIILILILILIIITIKLST